MRYREGGRIVRFGELDESSGKRALLEYPETTIRGAARLQINEMGRVTGCQPIFEASLNGDDATDLCNRADEQRYVALPSAVKDRGDRRMIVIRTLSFEVGEPPNKVPVG